MGFLQTRFARLAASVVTLSLMIVALPSTLIAQADTRPVNESDPATPVTVSADPLPTVQINGVVWSQVVVGNTVYVGGEFTMARPAGAAPKTKETPRANLLAYDIRTGQLIGSWAPKANGTVYALAASPDGKRIYAGGNFTSVSGKERTRIVALDPKSGAVINGFAPRVMSRVGTIVATNSRVYFGGWFTAVSGQKRNKFAAVQASNGALLSWAPNAQGGHGRAMAISPGGTKIALGGNFTSLNGSSNPGYGLAMVDASTGASRPMPANSVIRNAGPDASVLSLASDGKTLYISSYVYGTGVGGNLEGVARINWSSGSLEWLADCHGDTYSIWPMGNAIYAASHSHYCGNLPDGHPETKPQTPHWANAFSKATAGVLPRDIHGYANFEGNKAPNLLKWEPHLVSGTFTGQNQAVWHVTGNKDYLVYGGEFVRAGKAGTTQQGLVRYARRELAPNKMGPMLSGVHMKPRATSMSPGTVRLTWSSNWDRDNEQLTYRVLRNNVEIARIKGLSSEWKRPVMGYVDKGLVPGRQYSYRIYTTDPYGNEARGDSQTVKPRGDKIISGYAQKVINDGASLYWRLGENRSTSANTAYDWAGFNDGRMDAGVSGGQAGAIVGDKDPASSFNGKSTGLVATTSAVPAPKTFTVEAWVKTTSAAGGKIINFGNANNGANIGSANTGSSVVYDRQISMDKNGRLLFDVSTPTRVMRTVTSSAAYNDGKWHHVAASFGSGGMILYVDGKRVGGRTDTTSARAYSGYWRVGGDTGANYFSGQIDEVAVYSKVLTAAQIGAHYTASGQKTPAPKAAVPNPGGALAKDAFARSQTKSWGSADTGGSWSIFGSGLAFSVSNGTGRMTSSKAGTGFQANLESVSSTSTEASVKVTLSKVANGGGVFASLGARVNGNNDYRAKVKIAANGVLTIYLVRVVNGAETTLASKVLGTSFNYAASNSLMLKVQAKGTTSTALKAKVWKVGQAEPAWQLEKTEAAPASLRNGGGIGLSTYLSGSTTNTPVTVMFDDLQAVTVK